jgi:sugar-phosphatase
MRAVVFDMDGVLIDSEPLWRRAEMEVFESVGLRLSESDCERTTGLRTDELVGFWYDRRPWTGPPPSAVAEAIDARVTELIQERGKPLPGSIEAVRAVCDSVLATALASSSSRALINTVIAKLEIHSAFSVICSGTDEERGKPDPAIYLTAVRRLGLSADMCVAVEDSIVGVRAARAAGVSVIAVPAPHQYDHPGFNVANLKLRSLEHFSIDCLHRL